MAASRAPSCFSISAPSFAPSPSRAQSAPTCTLEWQVIPGDNQPGGSNGIGSLAVVNGHDIWAVGSALDGDNRNTLIEHWDGTDWTVVDSPNGPNEINFLTRAAAVATGDVWAVGYSRTPGFSGISKTLIEHWDGFEWTVVPSPNPQPPGDYEFSNELFGIAVVAEDDIWAVGQTYDFTDGDSLILHWDGEEWSVVDNPHPGLGGVLYGVTAVATDDVWAVGNSYFDGLQQSVVEHWDGENWTVVPSPNVGPFLNWFLSISATSADDIWAVGSTRPSSGRTRSTRRRFSTGTARNGVSCRAPTQTQFNNYLWDVVGLSATDAWAVGFFDTGTELQTMIQHWDGVEWTIVPSPNGAGGYISELIAVAAVSPTNVWAAGQAFDGFFDFETFFQEYGCDESEPVPTLQTITPASGPAAAGTAVHVAGSYLVSPLTLTIGGTLATDVVVNGFESIDATTPDLCRAASTTSRSRSSIT